MLMLCLFSVIFSLSEAVCSIKTLHCKQKAASALKLLNAGYISLAEVSEVSEVSAKRNTE